jgi:para-nitrobenzyl esterase
MNKLFLILFSIILLVSCKSEPAITNFLQKKIDSGIIEGVISEDGLVEKYLGIPYAKPPIGELRWKAPQKVTPWEGVLKTQEYGNIAMQYKFAPWVNFDENRLSEDCLYLNVWKPINTGDQKLPVLVNIHGGGLLVGEGSELRMEGTSMANKGMIVVTLNYRLNIFGFFAHPELSEESPNGASGNYGYLDQQFALQWVKNNIAVFGGDPNKITIAGESAGSWSVLSLMASPLSKNMITGAIGSSGGVIPLQPLEEAAQNGKLAAENAGFAAMSDLRNATAEEIITFYKNGNPSAFGPVLDNYVFTKNIPETFEAGEQAQIPLLIGWNSAELPAEAYLRGPFYTKENFEKITKELYPNDAEEMLKMFPHETTEEVHRSALDLASIRFIGLGAWKWFDLHRKNSSKPVYRYLYSKVHPPNKFHNIDMATYKAPLGARHAEEVAYSWGNLHLDKNFNFSEDDFKVSTIMQEYFSNFIKTGNPNNNELPEWPAVDANTEVPMIMNIDTNTELIPASLDYRFRFIDNAGNPNSN